MRISSFTAMDHASTDPPFQVLYTWPLRYPGRRYSVALAGLAWA